MKQSTDLQFYGSNKSFLRSSALKTLEGCSWQYHCNYALDIPQEGNKGSKMGSVCHAIFECLLKKTRDKKTFLKIIANQSIKSSDSVSRLVWKLIKEQDLPIEEEVFKQIDKMILVGLKTDFFVDGGIVIGSEYRFKHHNESPHYSILGTMDKIAIKGDYLIIDDFKSSKEKYKGEDKESNIQALLYSLAAIKFWPDKKPKVRFIFLQYPDDPIIEIEYGVDTLKGFEYYLEHQCKRIKNFSYKDAVSNFAADKPIPSTGEFKNKLLCGFAKFKGQLKKDGTKMWHCPYRFPFIYYQLIRNGKIFNSYLKKEDIKLEKGDQVIEKQYLGCPYFYPKDDFL